MIMDHPQQSNDAIIMKRSPSPIIPMPKYHIRRTKSEEQFDELMEEAEFRELCMFQRIRESRMIQRRNTKWQEVPVVPIISPSRLHNDDDDNGFWIEPSSSSLQEENMESSVLVRSISAANMQESSSSSSLFDDKQAIAFDTLANNFDGIFTERDENRNDREDPGGNIEKEEGHRTSDNNKEDVDIFMIEL